MITDLLTNLAKDQIALPEKAVPEQVDTEFSDVILANLADGAPPEPAATEPPQPMLPIALPHPPLRQMGSPVLHGNQLLPAEKNSEPGILGRGNNGSNPDAYVSIPQANLKPPYPKDVPSADLSLKEPIAENAVSAPATSQTNGTAIPPDSPNLSSGNPRILTTTAANPKGVVSPVSVPIVLPVPAPKTGPGLESMSQVQLAETPDMGMPMNAEILSRPESVAQTIAISNKQPVPLTLPENSGTVTSANKVLSSYPYPVEPFSGASTTSTFPNSGEQVSIKPAQGIIAPESQHNPPLLHANTPTVTPLRSVEIESANSEIAVPRTLAFPAQTPSIQFGQVTKPSTSTQPFTTNQQTNKPFPASTLPLPGNSTPELKNPVHTAKTDISATSDTSLARLDEPAVFSPIQFRESMVNTPAQVSPVPTQTRLDHGPQVAAAIAQAASTLGQQPVELMLNPEELGRVRLTLQTTEGSMAVSVAVERPETLELLRRHIDLLADQLRDIGFDDLSFDFAHDGEGTQTNDDSQAPPPQAFQIGQNEEPKPTARIAIIPENGIDIRL